jgi:epoxyqueuosine reductase
MIPSFLTIQPRPSSHDRLTAQIKVLAAEHGLGVVAVTSADEFPGLGDLLADRIDQGFTRGLDWFTPDRARFSASPRNLQASAHSMLTVGVPYWSGTVEKPTDVPRGRISRYAWGNDYHIVLKRRMQSLHEAIEQLVSASIEARLLVDTARIVDRAAAARSGLGWYGKHSCLIVPGHGSWVMLGTMLLDLELAPDQPLQRDCGRCSLCIDRCPTNAIVAPYTIAAPRCLSFQTIEQRGAIPIELRRLLGDWVFGCDVCQDVCPYTKAAALVDDVDFRPQDPERAFPRLDWLLSISEAEFRDVFRGSSVLRAKRRGIARNAAVALGNQPSELAVATLTEALREHDEAIVRGHAAWALGSIGAPVCRLALETALPIETDADAQAEIRAALERAS